VLELWKFDVEMRQLRINGSLVSIRPARCFGFWSMRGVQSTAQSNKRPIEEFDDILSSWSTFYIDTH